MDLRYPCPQCRGGNRTTVDDEETVLSCAHCDYVGLLPLDWVRGGVVARCPICGGSDLFRQRHLDQRLAICTLIAGLCLAPLTWFLSTAVAALLVLAYWFRAPERLVCYRCATAIRGHRSGDGFGRFSRATSLQVLGTVPVRRRKGDGREAPVE